MKNMENVLVSDVMTRNIITASQDDDLATCAKKMINKKIRSLLLVDGKKLIGILTEKDILWALLKKQKKDLSKIKAVDISPRKLKTIKPNVTVKEAINRINKMKFDRLPVTNNGELLGIITVKDILGFHPEFYPEFEEHAKIKEEEEKLKRLKHAKNREVVSDSICEECGARGPLYRFNGVLACASCVDSI